MQERPAPSGHGASAQSSDAATKNDGWRTIVDPQTGDRITFEITGAESGGAFVRTRGSLPPRSPGPARHRHLVSTETFTVLAGRLTLEVANRTLRLGPGESATVPRGVAHTFRNETDEPVEAIAEARPAARFEEFLRALYGLGHDGRLDPINFALVARFGESLPASPPPLIARPLVGALAWLGDRLGRDGSFPEYTRPSQTLAHRQPS